MSSRDTRKSAQERRAGRRSQTTSERRYQRQLERGEEDEVTPQNKKTVTTEESDERSVEERRAERRAYGTGERRARRSGGEEGTGTETISSSGNGQVLLSTLGDAGIDYASWAFEVDRPEGTRTVTIKDIANYVNTLSPHAFESIKNVLAGTLNRAGRTTSAVYKIAETWAEKAACAGLGKIMGEDE